MGGQVVEKETGPGEAPQTRVRDREPADLGAAQAVAALAPAAEDRVP